MPADTCQCGEIHAGYIDRRIGRCLRCFRTARPVPPRIQYGAAPAVITSTGTFAAPEPVVAPLNPPEKLTKQRRWESHNPEKTKEATRRRVQRYRERQKAGAGM